MWGRLRRYWPQRPAATDAGREHRRLVHHRRSGGGGGDDMKEGAAGRGAGGAV